MASYTIVRHGGCDNEPLRRIPTHPVWWLDEKLVRPMALARNGAPRVYRSIWCYTKCQGGIVELWIRGPHHPTNAYTIEAGRLDDDDPGGLIHDADPIRRKYELMNCTETRTNVRRILSYPEGELLLMFV